MTDMPSKATNSESLAAKSNLGKEIASLHTDLAVLKWMVGIVLVGVWAPIIKGYWA